jgi:hypothetical protein
MLAKLAKLKKLLNIDDNDIALSGIAIRDEDENPDELELDIKRNDDFEFLLKENKKGVKHTDNFKVQLHRNNKDDTVKINNPFLMNIPFALYILGVVKAGKSTLMRSILDIYYEAFDHVIFISPTHTLDPEAINLLNNYPEIKAYNSLSALEPIVIKLKKVNKGKDPSKKIKTLIIMDDVINEIIRFSRKDGNFMNSMMLNRRHIGISMIMMSQYFKRAPPLFRTNFSAFALFRQENVSERSKIIEELSGFLGKKKFEELFDAATHEPYGALTINFDADDKKYQYTKNFNTILI